MMVIEVDKVSVWALGVKDNWFGDIDVWKIVNYGNIDRLFIQEFF